MFDYLEKFNNLSDDIRVAVDSDEAVKVIEEIEKEYNVELASIVMRVVVKEISIDSLPLIFFTELSLSQEKSEKLAEDLKSRVLFRIANYLGFEPNNNVVDSHLHRSNKNKGGNDKSKSANDKGEDGKRKNEDRGDKTKGVDNKDRNDKGEGEDDKHEDWIDEDDERDYQTQEEYDEDLGQNSIDGVDSLGDEPYIEGQETLNTYLKDDRVDKVKYQANKIIEILNLKFGEDDKDAQFLDLLTKYLRGLKDKIEIRRSFSKSKEMGGFSLTDQMISNVFMIAVSLQEEELEEAKKSSSVDRSILDKINRLGYGSFYDKNDLKMIKAPDTKNVLPPLRPAVISDKKELVTTDDSKSRQISPFISSSSQLNSGDKEGGNLESKISAPVKAVGAAESFAIKKVVDSAKKTEDKITINDIDSSTGKIKMSDVRKMKIMGPIDEIRYLDLLNFRRLAKNPEEALVKIGEKIKMLESLDYGKMLEGIKAWRQSSIHKLYLKIFLSAGERGLGIEQIISELKSYGKDYLSKEELDAIIEFNKTLRF